MPCFGPNYVTVLISVTVRVINTTSIMEEVFLPSGLLFGVVHVEHTSLRGLTPPIGWERSV